MSGLDDHFGRINETITMFQNAAQAFERLADEKLATHRAPPARRLVEVAEGDLIDPAEICAVSPIEHVTAEPQADRSIVTLRNGCHYEALGKPRAVAAALGLEIA